MNSQQDCVWKDGKRNKKKVVLGGEGQGDFGEFYCALPSSLTAT